MMRPQGIASVMPRGMSSIIERESNGAVRGSVRMLEIGYEVLRLLAHVNAGKVR